MSTRKIFKYFNGEKEVFADPMVIERRFQKACESVDINTIIGMVAGPEWLGQIARTDEEGKSYDSAGNFLPEVTAASVKIAIDRQNEGIEELLPVLYETFGLKPLQGDGTGTTTEEILDAYSSYNEFVASLKKNTENEPSLPPSSGTGPAPTENGSASGTIESAPLPSMPSV
jgi:hypothetical protein